jgi:hypothetical protein
MENFIYDLVAGPEGPVTWSAHSLSRASGQVIKIKVRTKTTSSLKANHHILPSSEDRRQRKDSGFDLGHDYGHRTGIGASYFEEKRTKLCQ